MEAAKEIANDLQLDIDAELIDRVADKIGYKWSPVISERQMAMSHPGFKFAVCDFVMTHPDFMVTGKVLVETQRGVFYVTAGLIDEETGPGIYTLYGDTWFHAILLAADALTEKHD